MRSGLPTPVITFDTKECTGAISIYDFWYVTSAIENLVLTRIKNEDTCT